MNLKELANEIFPQEYWAPMGWDERDIIDLILNQTKRAQCVEIEFKNHIWRAGESYDKFLYKLLRKNGITLQEYYDYKDEKELMNKREARDNNILPPPAPSKYDNNIHNLNENKEAI